MIRTFEELISSVFSKGELVGTTHASIGQEAIPVGVINALDEGDFVISNHRGHGHYLAYANDISGLLAEVTGCETGVVGGRGGSQHLQNRNFYSNGVQGGMVPVATGLALAEKLKGSKQIAVSFIGDGTLGQGILYESLNIASLWEIPILFIVENNYYAMSTHIRDAVAGNIVDRGKMFNIKSLELEGNDVNVVNRNAIDIIATVRSTCQPFFLVLNTYRQCGHSKSDNCNYRSREEENIWLAKDPIALLKRTLDDKDKIKDIETNVRHRVDDAYKKSKIGTFR